MNWIDNSIKEYYDWLREETTITKDSSTGWVAISTPFIGLFNDNIEIYAKMEGERLILSDDGLTLSNLELVGVSISRSPKRKEWLNMICLNYGIDIKDNELQVEGTIKEFNQKKLNLLSAIFAIYNIAKVSTETMGEI